MPAALAQTELHPTPADDFDVNVTAFRWHLRSENLAPSTLLAYLGAVEALRAFLRGPAAAGSRDRHTAHHSSDASGHVR